VVASRETPGCCTPETCCKRASEASETRGVPVKMLVCMRKMLLTLLTAGCVRNASEVRQKQHESVRRTSRHCARRHVAPAVVVLGPRPSTCRKMHTRNVVQTSVRSVRNPRGADQNPCLHAENASDAPLAHERQKVRQNQRGSVRTSLRWEACQLTAGARPTRPETTVGIRHARAGAA